MFLFLSLFFFMFFYTLFAAVCQKEGAGYSKTFVAAPFSFSFLLFVRLCHLALSMSVFSFFLFFFRFNSHFLCSPFFYLFPYSKWPTRERRSATRVRPNISLHPSSSSSYYLPPNGKHRCASCVCGVCVCVCVV
ncbi:hypothetical protein DFJ73DRAFT_847812, partial [Zopfochytrium polystomum]